MVEKASSYEGTIKEFCKENNLQEKKFYYHRKKLKDSKKVEFHAISLKTKANITTKPNYQANIRIEVGNANIYIPANEIAALNAIIKELALNV